MKIVLGEVKRGTKIIFCLKAEQFVFSEERRLKDLVKILLEFIGFPLEVHVQESKEKAVTDSGEKMRRKARRVMSPSSRKLMRTPFLKRRKRRR